MRKKFLSIKEVVDSQLCSGCGACAYMQPDHIRMVDVPESGLRPHVQHDARGQAPDTTEALKACPGIGLEHPDFGKQN
jgi:coenzyme F420 hydrogenase subunit beta